MSIENEVRLLTPREAAQILKLSTSTLAGYRSRQVGPAYVRVGCGRGRIRYSHSALDAFVREGHHDSHSAVHDTPADTI